MTSSPIARPTRRSVSTSRSTTARAKEPQMRAVRPAKAETKPGAAFTRQLGRLPARPAERISSTGGDLEASRRRAREAADDVASTGRSGAPSRLFVLVDVNVLVCAMFVVVANVQCVVVDEE